MFVIHVSRSRQMVVMSSKRPGLCTYCCSVQSLCTPYFSSRPGIPAGNQEKGNRCSSLSFAMYGQLNNMWYQWYAYVAIGNK